MNLFEDRWPKSFLPRMRVAPRKGPSGYVDFLNLLESEAIAFGRPVVLVHGDTHYFRIDKPLFGTKSVRAIVQAER